MAVGTDVLRAQLHEKDDQLDELRQSMRMQEALVAEMRLAKEDARQASAALDAAEHVAEQYAKELKRVRQELADHRAAHTAELRRKEEEWSRRHRAELRGVQEAFDAYDVRMNGFLEKLQADHEDDAARWQGERRQLLHRIAEQEAEVAQLREALGVSGYTAAPGAINTEKTAPAVQRYFVGTSRNTSPPRTSYAPRHGPLATRYSPLKGAPVFVGTADESTTRYAEAERRLQARLDRYAEQRARRKASHRSSSAAAGEQSTVNASAYRADQSVMPSSSSPSGRVSSPQHHRPTYNSFTGAIQTPSPVPVRPRRARD